MDRQTSRHPLRISNLQMRVTKGLRLVEDSRGPVWIQNSILDSWEEEISRWIRVSRRWEQLHLIGRLALTLPNPMVINATRISRCVRVLPERFSHAASSRSGQRTAGSSWRHAGIQPRWHRSPSRHPGTRRPSRHVGTVAVVPTCPTPAPRPPAHTSALATPPSLLVQGTALGARVFSKSDSATPDAWGNLLILQTANFLLQWRVIQEVMRFEQ